MFDDSPSPGRSRRRFLKSLAATLALPALGDSSLRGAEPLFDNVVFVGVDDLNDWLSCLQGHPNAQTPNLDRIASAGLLFSDCHAAAPLCNPSRTSTYFGRLPTTTGVYLNDQDWRISGALAGHRSIFECFRAAGLKNYGMGKIHHKEYVVSSSWDDFWPAFDQPRPESDYSLKDIPASLRDADKKMRWGPLPATADRRAALADQKLLDRALATLDLLNNQSQRFALNIGFSHPHLPWVVPGRYFDRFPLAEIKLPFILAEDPQDLPDYAHRLAGRFDDHQRILDQGLWAEAVQAYLASISFMDDLVGELFQAYEDSGQFDRTVFVFWSDNGWHMGEKLIWRKLSLWREATRVPLMIVAPGLTKPGSVCRRPVSLTSLMATLCDLIGTETPNGVEGPSLLPLLRDPESSWDHPVISVLGPHNLALRTEDWCYIRYRDGREEELYQRARDPREFQNLAAVKSSAFKRNLAALMPQEISPYDPDDGSRRVLGGAVDHHDD